MSWVATKDELPPEKEPHLVWVDHMVHTYPMGIVLTAIRELDEWFYASPAGNVEMRVQPEYWHRAPRRP